MPFRSRYLLALVALLLVSPRAQASDAPQYEVAVQRAVTAYEAGDFEAAFEAFSRAHAVQPSARTHRGLGIVALRRGRPVLAYHHLRRALLDPRRPLEGPLREAVAQLLGDLEGEIARVQLMADGELQELRVDGAPPLRDASTGEILLLPGSHRLTVELAEGREVARELDLVAGSHVRLDLRAALASSPELRAAPNAPAADSAHAPGKPRALPSATTKVPSQRPERRGSDASSLPTGPLMLVSAGGAAFLAAAVTGALTVAARDELEQGCNSENSCYPEFKRDREAGMRLRTVTNGLLAAGSAALLSGALWWLIAGDEEPARLSPQVALGTEACILQLRGTL